MSNSVLTGILLIAIGLSGCVKEQADVIQGATTPLSKTAVPDGFPEIPFTEENPFTEEKWALGKKLFYDNILSVDESISCASCHQQSNAFSDVVDKSIGAGGLIGRRNSPTLANVAYHPYYTREGGVPTLEMQVLVPLQEHDEFNFNIVALADRMKAIPEYVEMSRKAFDREPDAYVITRALATFERTLISGNSPYDKYINDKAARSFTSSARRGMNLFFSERTNCSKCHSGFNFTNYSFQNNGLYEEYPDIGRKRFSGKDEEEATFKVPTLRNVALTAPYMHDGSINSLQEVVEHYNSGGAAHDNKSPLIKPLNLTKDEQQELVSFLESLTDIGFITNTNFQDETQ